MSRPFDVVIERDAEGAIAPQILASLEDEQAWKARFAEKRMSSIGWLVIR
jgi:hypothetical protein